MKNILFLDIETVSQKADFYALPEQWREEWKRRAKKYAKAGEETPLSDKRAATLYAEKSGLYAEFSQIVSIAVGFTSNNTLRIKKLIGTEKEILQQFAAISESHFNDPNKHCFCAHNGKGFDYPFMARRFLVNGLPIPTLLDISGKKPWESKHLLDTMDMWRFGDKAYISLNLLCLMFGIQTPKTGPVTGANLSEYYWGSANKNEAVKAIAAYNADDTVALARAYCALNKIPQPEKIAFV